MLTVTVMEDGNIDYQAEKILTLSMIIDNEEQSFEHRGKTYHCALDITMDYIGGKWRSVVLWYLMKDKKRFSELKKVIPDITEKMLSIQLKHLERDGLIERQVFAEVPPRVEYTLSPAGRSLMPLLMEIAAWGRNKGYNEGKIIKQLPAR
jgi:DNA-binding HxlR family transcriptional regulator